MAACRVSESVPFFARSSGAFESKPAGFPGSSSKQKTPNATVAKDRTAVRKAGATCDMGGSRVCSLRLMPGGIRIISGHCLCSLCCVGTQILLVDGSRFIDNERHHTRRAVLGGIGDERESPGHHAVDEIALRSAQCMKSLPREDPEKIAIERHWIANLAL